MSSLYIDQEKGNETLLARHCFSSIKINSRGRVENYPVDPIEKPKSMLGNVVYKKSFDKTSFSNFIKISVYAASN